MKRNIILNLCLLTLFCFSCEQEEPEAAVTPEGDEVVTFRAKASGHSTRAAEIIDLVNMSNLRIIAPGYGTGATNQSELYETGADGSMTKQPGNDDIRWSARNMVFTSWNEGDEEDKDNNGVIGWTIDKLGGTGTVDFSKNLENLIGANKTRNYERPVPEIVFTYQHLVAKVKINLRNIVNEADVPEGCTITYPAIKQIGVLTAGLTGIPTVSLGQAGNELSYSFNEKGTDPLDGSVMWSLTGYMPPMTANELLMYGSFTVREQNGTSYVGTLQNLDLETGEGLKAGFQYTFDIIINNDNTALLQAVTLAPWEVYPKSIYNRPSNGIWGLEDLQALSKLINGEAPLVEGKPTWNKLTMEDLYIEEDGKKIINLYTDIAFKADDEFAAIGKAGSPFAGYEFNGNGYTISNLALKNPGMDNQGLFGLVGDNATKTTIKNLTVSAASVEGQKNVGALVGQTSGVDIIIDHCFVTGGEVLGGQQNTGGVIGLCGAGTTVRNCGATPSIVSGSENVGGFVGQNDGTIGNSYSQTGSLICSTQIGGGFIGQNNNTVQNCYSVASFSYGLNSIGAFAGHHLEGKTMKNCYWNTECINNTTCSKVVGNSEPDEHGVEEKPSGFSGGRAFAKNNGQIVYQNTTYEPLYDVLNNFVYNNDGMLYLRWARINGITLPVFAY